MPESVELNQSYLVTVESPRNPLGCLDFTFVLRAANGGSRWEFTARADTVTHTIDWSRTRDKPGEHQREIEKEIERRLRLRSDWIERVERLATNVEQWARQADWATKRIKTQLEDSLIGKHELPAVLMQKEIRRVLLEPIGRSSPGTEGVVDLYLMPGYDDIASIYYYNDRWNIHYILGGETFVSAKAEATPMELTAENLLKVLTEMH